MDRYSAPGVRAPSVVTCQRDGLLTCLSAPSARHRQLITHLTEVQRALSVAQPLTNPSADDDSQLPEGPYSGSTPCPSPDVTACADSPPVTTRRATQPRRLAPFPSLFRLITFRRFSSVCFHRRRTNIGRVEQICRIETSDVIVKSNTERELQPLATPRRATPRPRTWIERVSPYHHREFSRVTRYRLC